MLKHVVRKLAIGAALLALVPAALAQTGTDPEPRGGVVQVILTYLGLA